MTVPGWFLLAQVRDALAEGDVLDTERLAQSMQGLDRLPFLRPLSRFELRSDAREENVLDVIFVVREREPFTFDFGGGALGRRGRTPGSRLVPFNLPA